MRRAYREIVSYSQIVARAEVTAYAAQAAFFIFLSFSPFLMLILMLLQRIPELNERLMLVSLDFFPSQVSLLLGTLISDTYRSTSSAAIISITAAAAVWSAGKGVHSIIRGLNAVCSIQETRRYIWLRVLVLLYTVMLVLLVLISLTVIVFGGVAADWLLDLFMVEDVSGLHIRFVTVSLMTVILLVSFIAIYIFFPARRQKIRNVWLGALVSAVGWVVFSLFFAVYVERFSNLSVTYGSLTSVVALMLWLYACMYILFLGAVINEVLTEKDGLTVGRGEIIKRKKTKETGRHM